MRRIRFVLYGLFVCALAGPIGHTGPRTASADVDHALGFHAVVDGYRSWFGVYGMGELGRAWCIDHGIAAPDPDFAYVKADVADHAAETRRAMAWALFRGGRDPDRVGAAALMLVLHDLMGARYPSGPLNVDALAPEGLGGFDGAESEVVDRARAIKADAVAHAPLIGPFVLAASAATVRAGAPGVLATRLTDAMGQPVAGVLVHVAASVAELTGSVEAITGDDGTLLFPFTAGEGDNDFAASAEVAGELDAYAPTRQLAQRVARPSTQVVSEEAAFTGVAYYRVSVQKTGDATPLVPVAGARFALDGVAGELVADANGDTPSVELSAGHYVLREVGAPVGYAAGGPWDVDLTTGDAVVHATDAVLRGAVDVRKIDSVTKTIVEGAVFQLRSATGDAVGRLTDVMPGHYEVVETTAPPHYRLAPDRVDVDVTPGATTTVTVADQPLATVAFVKTPPIAGARFAVTTIEGLGAGACTTDAAGRCSLPVDALEGGREYAWSEDVAPEGWLAAAPGRFTAGAAGSTTEIAVAEERVPAPPLVVTTTTTSTTTPTTMPVITTTTAAIPPETRVEALPPIERTVIVEQSPTPILPVTGAPLRRLAGYALALIAIGAALLALASLRRATGVL